EQSRRCERTHTPVRVASDTSVTFECAADQPEERIECIARRNVERMKQAICERRAGGAVGERRGLYGDVLPPDRGLSDREGRWDRNARALREERGRSRSKQANKENERPEEDARGNEPAHDRRRGKVYARSISSTP